MATASAAFNAMLLLLLAAPALYWRCLHWLRQAAQPYRQADRSAAPPADLTRQRRLAVGMTAAAQLIGLALTAAALAWFGAQIDREAQARFDREVDHIEGEITHRFSGPANALRGAAAMYAAMHSVTRPQFRAFVEARRPTEAAGVRAFGFIQRVMRDDLDRFVAAERAGGATEFSVTGGGGAPDAHVVAIVEPLLPNHAALGLDLGADPGLRESIERVVDGGEPVLADAAALYPGQALGAGFLYLLPVYHPGRDVVTARGRRAALIGVLFAHIVAGELLSGIAGSTADAAQFELAAHDRAKARDPTYDSLGGAAGPRADASAASGQLRAERDVRVADRVLSLRVHASQALQAGTSRGGLVAVGLGGALSSLLLALAVWSLASSRLRAQTLAQRMTAEINRLAQVVRHTSNAVTITDSQLRITWVNEGFTRITGYEPAEARGRTPGDLLGCANADPAAQQRLMSAAQAGRSCRVEILNCAKGGREYWIDTEVQPLRDARGGLIGFMEIGTDTTAQHDAHRRLEAAGAALARERQRLENILRGTRVGTWEWNTRTGVTQINERWAAMLGYTRDELDPVTEPTWAALAHAEDLQRSNADLRRHCDGEIDYYEGELRLRHKQGHWVWVLSRGSVSQRDAGGRAETVAGTHMDITERKQAEQQNLHHQAVLQSIIDNLPCGLSVFDRELRLVAHNARFKRLLDLPPTLFESGATTLDSLIRYNAERGEYGSGDVDAIVAQIVERANVAAPHETQRVRPNGVTLEIRGAPLPHGGFVTTYTDVSAEVKAQQVLRDSEHMMRLVTDNMPGRLAYFDAQRRMKFANRATYEFHGGTPAERIGQTFEELLGPALTAFAGDAADQALAGKAQTYDSQRDAGNGLMTYAVVHLLPDSRDGVVHGFVAMAMDVTAVKRSEQAVRSAEALLRGAIEAVGEAFVLYDADDRLVYCNDKYREIYSTSADLIVPGATFEQIARGGAERGRYKDAIGRVDAWVAERMAAHRGDNVNVVQKLDDGRWLRVIERHMPDGHIVGFRIDITDLKNASERAELASLAKSQFVANMSHEIRSPMSAILGMLRLLRSTPLSPRQLDYTGKAEGAARALLGLVDDILDFSKVEAGKMTLDPRPFAIDALLRDLSVILSANVGGKALELLFDLDPALPARLVGDALRLQQVLVNLAGNAIKFTAAGEVVVRIRVLERGADECRLAFSVRDTGIGVAPELHEHIFSAFEQAEASTTRRFGGTGLGLSISQRLVGMMGGRIELDSKPGAGSNFHFQLSLPIAPEQAAAREAGALRTLIVDDNAVARQVLASLAESLGWSADVASGGHEAIECVQRARAQDTPYDVILVDWHMPDMDGWQTSRRLHDPAGAQAPLLLMVSAHGREELAARPADEQALLSGYLVKPVTASMLRDAVIEARGGGASPTDLAPTPARLAGLRLLVVDDSANNRQVAQELLEGEGAQVELAGNGEQGVAAIAAAQASFDAVLMDLQMPVMDGYTAATQIRQRLGLAGLPIIAMTANVMASDRDACLAAGMNDHVGKPFDLDELVALLLRHVGAAALAAGARPAAPHAARPAPLTLPPGLVAQARQLGFELDGAVARLGGRADIWARSARHLDSQLADLPGELAQLLRQARWADAGRLMHTLKGVAGTLGAMRLSELAAAAERALGVGLAAEAAGDWQVRVSRLTQQTRDALGRLLPAMQPFEPSPVGRRAKPSSGALRQRIAGLAALLADADMAATDHFAELQATHEPDWCDELQGLSQAIAALDFERALAECAKLTQQLADA